jgi:hypothetical protein
MTELRTYPLPKWKQREEVRTMRKSNIHLRTEISGEIVRRCRADLTLSAVDAAHEEIGNLHRYTSDYPEDEKAELEKEAALDARAELGRIEALERDCSYERGIEIVDTRDPKTAKLYAQS